MKSDQTKKNQPQKRKASDRQTGANKKSKTVSKKRQQKAGRPIFKYQGNKDVTDTALDEDVEMIPVENIPTDASNNLRNSAINMKPIESIFEGVEFFEHVNKQMVVRLKNNGLLNTIKRKGSRDMMKKHAEEKHLTEWMEGVRDDIATTSYDPKDHGWGRVLTYRQQSLGNTRCVVRGAIVGADYVDIDANVCHHAILNQICKALEIDAPALNYYVNNSADCRAKVQSMIRGKDAKAAYKLAKKCFIVAMYGGDPVFHVGKNQTLPTCCTGLVNEIPCISKKLQELNPAMARDIRKVFDDNNKFKEKKSKNFNGTFLSYYCMEWERRMLEVVYTMMANEGIIDEAKPNCVLCYDGIMVLNENIKMPIPELLAKCTTAVEKSLGLRLEFSQKPLDRSLLDTLNKMQPKELLIRNEHQVRKAVMEYWKVDKIKKMTIKGTTLTYTAGSNKVSYYQQDSGRLHHWPTNDKTTIEPLSPKWDVDDWGKVLVREKNDAPIKVLIRGDKILCEGARLPEMQFTANKTYFEDGILYIKIGSTAVIQACMGLGKTYNTIRAVDKIVKAGKRVVYVTYRQSLASQLFTDLCNIGIKNVLHYKKGMFLGDGKYQDFKQSMVSKCSVMVVQAESIAKAYSANWDVIMTDEVQGLSAQFESEATFKITKPFQAWNMLKDMYQRTPTAMFMDADFEEWTERGKEFVNTMRGPYTHIVHTAKPQKRQFIDCGKQEDLLKKIIAALEAGLKVFVVSNTRTFIKDKLIPNIPSGYTATSFYGGKPLKESMNINSIASKVDLLAISSGSIGSGVSIEDALMYPRNQDGSPPLWSRPFDVCFAFGMAYKHTSCLREWYQGLSRVRNIARGLYFYSIEFNGYSEYVNTATEIGAIHAQRELLFKNRQNRAAAEADAQAALDAQMRRDFHAQKLVSNYALQLCIDEPAKVSALGAAGSVEMMNLFLSRGLIPDLKFVNNIVLAQEEHQESVRYFRSLLMQRILKDGHEHFVLDVKKESERSLKSANPLGELLKAVPVEVPENEDDYSNWNVTEVVKKKSHIVKRFNLDPTRTQQRWTGPPLTVERVTENEMYNAPLVLFFGDKIKWTDIRKYNSCRYRWQTLDTLEKEYKTNKISGTQHYSPLEVHIKFNKAMGTVFKDFIALDNGEKGFFEPADEQELATRMQAIDELIPGLPGKRTWNARSKAMVGWFEEKGVQTCLSRNSKDRKNHPVTKKKAQVWILNPAENLEYTYMMGYSLTAEQVKQRNHRWDNLRLPNKVLYRIQEDSSM